MKDKFQSNDVGMTLGGASVQHPFSIRSASDGTSRRPGGWKYIFTIMLLLTMGIGQVWAADIFSASCKVSSDVTVNSETTDQTVTSAQADITGGSMYVSNGETSGKKLMLASAGPSGTKKAAFALTNGKTYFKVVLSQALEAGDVISAVFYPNSGGNGNGLWFTTATTRPGSAPSTRADKASSVSTWTDVSYTVVANDGICGETTFCIFRGSSTTTNFTNFVITRSSGGGNTDTKAPAFVSSVPANNATNVAKSGTIVLTFDEDIASFDASKFTLTNATKGTVAKDGTNAKKINVPYSDANNSTTVTLSVAAEAVADAAGNKSAALSNISFSTEAAAEEKAGIKMVVNNALTGNFRVKADQLKTGACTVEGINYAKYVQMGSTHTSFSGETEGNQAKGIYYAPAKKNIKFWFYMRNTDSSARKIYIYKMEEGSSVASATVTVEPGSQLVSYDMTLSTNAEVIFGVENTKLYFCQIVAVESGDALLQGGEAGYVFDYSKKRQNIAQATARTIDGIEYYLSAESKINSGSNVQLTTLGTHYIKFHLDARTKVSIECDNKPYYIGTSKTGDAAQIYSGQDDGAFNLAVGDWYINGAGQTVKITKLSFLEPDAAYAVTYAAGTGSVKSGKSLPTHDDAMKDEKFTLASGENLEKSGYDFVGWEWIDNNNKKDTVQAGDEFTMPAYAVTFTACWVEHVAKYGVKFMDGETKLDSVAVKVGEAPVFANPTKPLYTFAGWNDANAAINLSDLATSVTKEDSVVVLYAQWNKVFAQNIDVEDYAYNTGTNKTAFLAWLTNKGYNYDNLNALDNTTSNNGAYAGMKANSKDAYYEFRVAADKRVTIKLGYMASAAKMYINEVENTTQALTGGSTSSGNANYAEWTYDVTAESIFKLQMNTTSTCVLKGITIGEIPAKSDVATLSDLTLKYGEAAAATISGFSASKYIYNVDVPYGTAKADLPIVGATATDATNALVSINQAKDREDWKTIIRVQAEDRVDAHDKYYEVRFNVEPKLGVKVFEYTFAGSNGMKTATGYKGGKADVNLQTSKTNGGYKLGSVDMYFGIAVDGGIEANDIVYLNIADLQGASALTFFDGKTSSKTQVITPAPVPAVGSNYMTVPTDLDSLYLYRVDGKCNPSVISVAVYRLMDPFIESFKIGEAVGTITGNTIAIELPNGTSLSGLAATVEAYANGGATIVAPTALAYNTPLVYTVSSAYTEDAPVAYTLTITEAAAIKEVVISGTLAVLEDETTTLSAVVYDTNDQVASIQNVTWSVKAGDEALASVTSAGVVTGKAVGTAHIIATSVADNTKSAEVAVVVSENPCRTWSNPSSKETGATIGKMAVTPTAIGTLQTNMVPYQDATATNAWKLDTKDSRYAEIKFTDNAQFESLLLGVSSKDSNKNYKFAVVCSSAAGNGFAAGVLSATAYEAVDNDEAENLVDVELPAGTKAVRVYREYTNGSSTIGGGSSVFLYYINACKKELVALTAVSIANKSLAIGVAGTPAVTLTPANADVASYAWEIVSDETGEAIINAATGVISSAAIGAVTVKVTATDELNNEIVSNVATINIVNKYEAVKPVTGTTVWNWAALDLTGYEENGPTIADPDTVLANYFSGEEWQQLAGGVSGRPYRNTTNYKCFQGYTLYFETTVPGMITLKAGRISNDQKVYVNGHEVGKVESTTKYLSKIAVPAGKVYITSGSNGMRIYEMKFDPNFANYALTDNALNGYTREVNAGRYGTICLPYNGVMVGAMLYAVAYFDAAKEKIFFDEIINGEMVGGTPYIFLPNEGVSELGVFYTGTDSIAAGNANGLYGSYKTEVLDKDAGNYILQNNQYRYVGSGSTNVKVGAYRAYIKLGEIQTNEVAPAPGRRRIEMGVVGEQVATGMENGGLINGENSAQKLMIDGQMFILRGEKMYDATGKLVK